MAPSTPPAAARAAAVLPLAMARSPLADVRARQLLRRAHVNIPSTPSDPTKRQADGLFLSPRRKAMDAMREYEPDKVIGHGTFGLVSRMRCARTGELVAVKVVDLNKLTTRSLRRTVDREVRVLKRLEHPSCISLLQLIEMPSTIHLVLEYVDGCTVQALVDAQPSGRMDEASARAVLWQLLDAVEHCHQRRVCHRDIKLENLLLDRPTRRIKLIDFGLSVVWRENSPLLTGCNGTLAYMAPEVVANQPYLGPHVDVWSVGVALGCMLSGMLPFRGSTEEQLKRRVLTGEFQLPSCVRADARSLLRQMLTVQPEARASIGEVRRAKWMRELSIHDTPAVQPPAVECEPGGGVDGADGAGEEESPGSGLDCRVLSELERLGLDAAQVSAAVEARAFNHESACYVLVQRRLERLEQQARERRRHSVGGGAGGDADGDGGVGLETEGVGLRLPGGMGTVSLAQPAAWGASSDWCHAALGLPPRIL